MTIEGEVDNTTYTEVLDIEQPWQYTEDLKAIMGKFFSHVDAPPEYCEHGPISLMTLYSIA